MPGGRVGTDRFPSTVSSATWLGYKGAGWVLCRGVRRGAAGRGTGAERLPGHRSCARPGGSAWQWWSASTVADGRLLVKFAWSRPAAWGGQYYSACKFVLV